MKSILRRIFPEDITVELGRSATSSVALRAINAVLALFVSVLLARLLGAEGYGVYTFAFSVIVLLALPAQAGLPTLLVREIARYDMRERWDLMVGLIRRSNQGVMLLTILITFGAGLVVLLGAGVGGEASRTLLWALALLPIMSLGNLRGAALRGLRRVIQGQLPEYLIRPGLLVVFLLTTLLIGSVRQSGQAEVTPSLAMALHAIAALCAFLAGVWLLHCGMPKEARRVVATYRTRFWLSSLLPLTLLAGVEMINSQMDVVLLGMMASPRDVGIYRVAWQMSMPIMFTLTAVNLVIGPYFARAYQSHEKDRLQRLATWSARVALMLAIPATLLLMLQGEPILGFVFGGEFAAGSTALSILCIGQLCNAAAGSVGTLLNMTGHERDTVLGVGVAAVVNLSLNLILIPKHGIVGAAVATMMSMIVWNTVLLLQVRRRMGIVSWAWKKLN